MEKTKATAGDPLAILKDAVSAIKSAPEGMDTSQEMELAERAIYQLYDPATALSRKQIKYRDNLKAEYDAIAVKKKVETRPFSSLPPDERMSVRCEIMERVLKCDVDGAQRLASWAEKKGTEDGIDGLRDIASRYLNRYVLSDKRPEPRPISELTQHEQTTLVAVFARLAHKFRRLTEDSLIDLAARECSLRGVDFNPAGAMQAILDDTGTYFDAYRELIDDGESEKAAVEGIEITAERAQLLRLLAWVIDIYHSGNITRYAGYEAAMRESVKILRSRMEHGSARFADFVEECLDSHRYPQQPSIAAEDGSDDVTFDSMVRAAEIAKNVRNANMASKAH